MPSLIHNIKSLKDSVAIVDVRDMSLVHDSTLESIYSIVDQYVTRTKRYNVMPYQEMLDKYEVRILNIDIAKAEFMDRFKVLYMRKLIATIQKNIADVCRYTVLRELNDGDCVMSALTCHWYNVIMLVITLCGVTNLSCDPAWLSQYKVDGQYTETITILANHCVKNWQYDPMYLPKKWRVPGKLHNMIAHDYYYQFICIMINVINDEDDYVMDFDYTFPVHEPRLEKVLLDKCKDLLIDIALYAYTNSDQDLYCRLSKLNMKYLLEDDSKFFKSLVQRDTLVYYTPYWNRSSNIWESYKPQEDVSLNDIEIAVEALCVTFEEEEC